MTTATDPVALTEVQRAQLRTNIDAFCRVEKIPKTKLSRMAGYSDTVLTECISGKYSGGSLSAIDEVLKKVEATMADHLNRKAGPGSSGFVHLRTVRYAFSVIRTTVRDRGIAAIYGESGIGKSKTLAAIKKSDYPSALLLNITRARRTPTGFLNGLLELIDVHFRPKTASRAFLDLVERLSGTGRVILIDEAENLRMDTLNDLRQLHDETGCPVILVGRDLLKVKLDRSCNVPEMGPAFVGRMTMEIDLHAVADEDPNGYVFSEEEIIDVLRQFRVKFTSDAGKWLALVANLSLLSKSRERGGLRFAVKIFGMAMMMRKHDDEEITLGLVEKAARLCKGKHYTDEIRTRYQQSQQRRAKTA